MAHYGDPQRERAVVEEGCGLFDASATPCLEMRGEDRHRFLNGLVTADVEGLAAGESRYGLFATIKGRILADVTVLAHEESFWLRLPAGTDEEIAAHLGKHVVTDRVEIAPLTGYSQFLLIGTAAAERFADRLDGGEVPSEGSHRPGRIEEIGVVALAERLWPYPAYSLWVRLAEAADLFQALVETEGVDAVGFEALERSRIELGMPRFGADFGPETFPQEAGLDTAVSYEKGCYLGQEVIARIHYRGGVKRRLVVLEGVGEELPEIEEAVLSPTESGAAEEVGRISSRTPRSIEPGWRALALVKIRVAEPDTSVTLASGAEARVIEPAGARLTVVR